MPIDVQVGGLIGVNGKRVEANGGASLSAGMEESWSKWNDLLARVQDPIRPVRRERHALERMNILIFSDSCIGPSLIWRIKIRSECSMSQY
jgi:hypothetical protein